MAKRRPTTRRKRTAPRAAASLAVSSPEFFVRYPWQYEAGTLISADTSLQVAAVYACCRMIVDSLAPAPVRVYEVQRGGRRELREDDPTAFTLNYGAPIQAAADAPPAQAIEEALYWSALLSGNGYAEIGRDGAGKFFGLWPLEPDRVMPKRDETGYFYEVHQPTGGTARVDPVNMFHLRGPSLFGWAGDSAVYRAAKAIGISQAAQTFSAAYFANGTVLAGIIKYPGKMTKEQKAVVGEDFRKNYSGKGGSNAFGVPIFDQGLDYQQINHDAKQSQLIEARRFQVAEIARFFGVPTTLLADNEAWTNLTELYLGFYRNALLPWAERFDAEATRKLFPQRQPWREVQHDLTRIVMGSFREQVEALRGAVAGGLKSRNEARAILGDNDLGPDGDVMMVDGTVKALEDVLRPPAPVVPPAPTDDDEEDGDPAEPMNGGSALVRTAAVEMFADAFERHGKRIANRKADSRRGLTDEHRQEFRAKLLEDAKRAVSFAAAALLRNVTAEELAAFGNAVEQGEPPALAAGRLLEART